MSDALSSAPSDLDPDLTIPGADGSEDAAGQAFPFNVEDDVQDDLADLPDEPSTPDAGAGTDGGEEALDDVSDFGDTLAGDDAIHSWDVDPDGVLYSPVDPTYTIGTSAGQSIDELDPDDSFDTEDDALDDALDDGLPPTSDEIDPDGVFGSPLDPHNLMDTQIDSDLDAGVHGDGFESDSYDADTSGS